MATRIAGDLRALVGDTIRFRWVAELDAATPPDSACTPRTAATATIVAAPEAYRLEEERVSAVGSVLGTVAMSAAVGLTILLLVSAADGIIDAVGRWF
jgi:hypothetical protein